jgi:hypothetical protein
MAETCAPPLSESILVKKKTVASLAGDTLGIRT